MQHNTLYTMDTFFKNSALSDDMKSLFTLENVTDEEFYELSAERILGILRHDLTLVNEFLTKYNSEKAKLSNATQPISFNEMKIIENEAFHEITDDDELVESTEKVVDYEISKAKKKTSVEASYHKNLPDDFEFIKNSMYYMLDDDIEGRVILGVYKYEKVLFERRLKHFVIKKIITENPIKYIITKERLTQVRDSLKELFPTIDEISWFKPPSNDALGNRVPASGCLLNYYKKFKGELGQARIIALENRSSTVISADVSDANTVADDLLCLKDADRTQYDIAIVSKVWNDSFKKRQEILIQVVKKKVVIFTKTYLNTFNCLKQPLGLSLLHSDCTQIIKNLYDNGKIGESIAKNFGTVFEKKWPVVADIIIKIIKCTGTSDGKEFKRSIGDSINTAPASTIALLYLSIPLTKAITVKKGNDIGTTFQRIDISNHFIKHLRSEAEIEKYKKDFAKVLSDVGYSSHPYVIVCGSSLSEISNAFVVVNDDHYSFTDPVRAVNACFRACVALHSWSIICANIWLYLQYHIYGIEPNVSCTFPQVKAFKAIKDFIKKTEVVSIPGDEAKQLESEKNNKDPVSENPEENVSEKEN